MTKLEKQFLDCCITHYLDRSIIGSDDLLKYVDVPLSSLQRCAERLEANGYIKNLHIHTRLRFNFQLTYEGTVYNEIRIENNKRFFIEIRIRPYCCICYCISYRCVCRLSLEHAEY